MRFPFEDRGAAHCCLGFPPLFCCAARSLPLLMVVHRVPGGPPASNSASSQRLTCYCVMRSRAPLLANAACDRQAAFCCRLRCQGFEAVVPYLAGIVGSSKTSCPAGAAIKGPRRRPCSGTAAKRSILRNAKPGKRLGAGASWPGALVRPALRRRPLAGWQRRSGRKMALCRHPAPRVGLNQLVPRGAVEFDLLLGALQYAAHWAATQAAPAVAHAACEHGVVQPVSTVSKYTPEMSGSLRSTFPFAQVEAC